MFSGIGGFELGIQKVGTKPQNSTNSEKSTSQHSFSPFCVGYSEIDKYADQIYQKHFGGRNYGASQSDLDNIKTILSDSNYDILEICYVNTAKQGQIFIQPTSLSAKIALTDTRWSGVKKILQSLEKTKGDIELCTDRKCLICMVESVSVVEKRQNNSLHLNTETEMDISTEKNTEQAICIGSPSSFTTQKNTKSYATTVITLKEGTVYVHIRKQVRNWGDATKINAKELPDFDLLVGGFPCQAFSVAGKRAGFNDTRGTLFFDIARICKEKRPQHLVLENVKGLLSHDSGKTFQTILGVLADLGYFVEWQVLNSKYFGVPQNRERVFIVGHLGGEPRRKVFPIYGTNRQNRLSSDAIAWSKSHRTGKSPEDYKRKNRGKTEMRINKNGILNTLSTGDGCGNQSTSNFIDKYKIRRLTPLECERLQGFPDGHTEGLSDTQRYKTLGNAVTVNVVQAVMEKLL